MKKLFRRGAYFLNFGRKPFITITHSSLLEAISKPTRFWIPEKKRSTSIYNTNKTLISSNHHTVVTTG